MFPTKSSQALEISQSQHNVTLNRNRKSSVLIVDKEDAVPQWGCMVRNHPHLISWSQLCTHSVTCIVDAGWFAAKLRWEFSLPQRMPEIIMSQGQDLCISSIFIKSWMIFLHFTVCHLYQESRFGSLNEKKSYYYLIQVLMIYRLDFKITAM